MGSSHYRKVLAECVGLKGRPGQRGPRLALTASHRAWALGVDPDCHATPRGRAGADVALPAWGTQRRGERMPPHPEPALPGLSGSTPCRPGGREETLRLHPLAPSPDGERFQFSPPSGESEPRGQAASPVPCRGGAWQCPLARLSVCSSGWCQPCSLVRTKLSFSAEGRTRDTGKGRFWKLLLLTRRVGPGYLPRPLARKREARLQGTSWTVGRADP